MARARRKASKLYSMVVLVVTIISALFIVSFVSSELNLINFFPKLDDLMMFFNVDKDNDNLLSNEKEFTSSEEILEVHFIDVGQADCILVKLEDNIMLVDAGENDDGPIIESYLREQGVSEIDILVGTHPHADHIGAMDYIIDSFDIGQILMPKIPQEILPSTKTFKDVLIAIKNKNLTIKNAKAGLKMYLGDAKLEFVGPMTEYDNLNNISAAIKLKYNSKSFLLTGDAEKEAEDDMIKGVYDLKSDVLKVGHHGSTTSTTQEFLSEVQPNYAVIQTGEDNRFGHPHGEILKRLEDSGTTIYRTDLDGNIVFKTDGINMFVETSK